MDKDELTKYKWLDAHEVRPPTNRGSENASILRLQKKMLEFLMDD